MTGRLPRDVLDVACAAGKFTRLFPRDRYVGVDVSATALAEGRRQHPEATFLQGDLGDAEFFVGLFDLVICTHTRTCLRRENLGRYRIFARRFDLLGGLFFN